MTRRGGIAAGIVLAAAALASACSRGEDAKTKREPVALGPRAEPELGPGVNALAPPASRTPYTMAQVFDAEARAGSDFAGATPPVALPTKPAPSAPPAASAPPKTNPDDAALERTRVACGGCFSSLPAGPGFPTTRSARVSLVVIPTGSVSRADVTSDDTDNPEVLECIRSTAQEASFSDNGGGPLRTYAIDVRVSAPGANGSR